jgi:hypothetical protein
LGKGDFNSALRDQGRLERYNKERIIILAVWFVSLVGIRLLLGLELSNIWGTTGAVAITFVIFYLALRYTPFSRYSAAVNSALRDWYDKRYVLYGLVSSMVLLLGLMILVEIGYTYHADKVVSIWDLGSESAGTTQSKVTASLNALLDDGYSGIDALAITIASVDKSLEGHYLQSISFVFAEDIEILIFMLLMKRIGPQGIFPTKRRVDKNTN